MFTVDVKQQCNNNATIIFPSAVSVDVLLNILFVVRQKLLTLMVDSDAAPLILTLVISVL